MKKTIALVFIVMSIALSSGICLAHAIDDERFLDMVQKRTLNYFLKCMDPETGLTMDRADNFGPVDYSYSPSTTAGVGFGLTALAVGAERGWITREYAKRVTLNTLKHFYYKMENVHGFFYHFTKMKDGKREWKCELSSIDTALFIAGAVFAGEYYNDPEIKKYASLLYYRVDWKWMTNGKKYICMGWKPEEGFLNCYWSEYCELMILYVLAIGSPTHPVSPEVWKEIKRPYGEYEGKFGHIYCSSLFTHQYSHIWIDFSNKNDGIADYFYNSRMATLANRQFCIDSAATYPTFRNGVFGLTASIGPDGYIAYGAPPAGVVNDGTVAPTGAGASIIFTPKESIAALRQIYRKYKKNMWGQYGFSDSFNVGRKWFAKDAYAINQGPIVAMIENYRSGLVHKVFMKNRCVEKAMRLVGFRESEGFTHDMSKLRIQRNRVYRMGERPTHASAKVDDGFVLDETAFDSPVWKNDEAAGFILDEKFIQGGVNNQPGFGARVDLRDNSKYLFIKVSVKDSEVVSKMPDKEMYLDDAVEVFIDPDNDKFRWGNEKDFQLVISPAADMKSLRVTDVWLKGAKDRTVGRVFRITPEGYEFILALPKSEFKLKPGVCAFSVAVHNADEKRGSNCKLNSFYCDPGVYLGLLKINE